MNDEGEGAFHDTIWVPIFVKRGFLKDLTPYVKDSTLTPAGFDYPGDFQNVEISGNYKPGNAWHLPEGIWGMPLIAGWRVLYYRTDLLKQAGLAHPARTMDELVMYAQKMNDSSHKTYGYVMSGSLKLLYQRHLDRIPLRPRGSDDYVARPFDGGREAWEFRVWTLRRNRRPLA